MTILEENAARAIGRIPVLLGEIKDELARMNKLKALELKGRHLEISSTPGQVDEIMKGGKDG